MKKHLNLAVVLVSAIFFTVLFYKKSLGINLFLYEIAILCALYFMKQFQLKNRNEIATVIGVILTASFTVIHHSNLSYIVNFLLFFTFIGVIISPEIKSLLNSIGTSFSNIFASTGEFMNRLTTKSVKSKSLWYKVRRFRIFFIPLIIILLFSIIYSWANPEFGKIVDSFWSFISEQISEFLLLIDFSIIAVFLFGLGVSVFIFLRKRNESLLKKDINSSEDLLRLKNIVLHGPTLSKQRVNNKKILALLNEYRSAVFLFASLNILLFGLNILDFNHVWIDFEWEGQFLKQFVHEGTYVLIFAILISILLVLYFFRANLNFYKKNKALRILCYLWLAQNVFLTVSVGVRNWYYIQYYALAYKRIAIIFFLVLTVYGLYSVYKKVKGTKSKYYLTKNNAFAWLMVLVVSTFFNWDRIIANYNFENSKKSFVHLNYLSELSDSALPFLDRPRSELENIQVYQETSFFIKLELSSSNYRKVYMGPTQYLAKIKLRKEEFIREWESKGVLEWNYAEYQAYHELTD